MTERAGLLAAAIPVQTLVLLFLAITAAWVVVSVVVMRRHRRDREVGLLQARPRQNERRMASDDAGRFVPLAPVFEEEPEPEPDLEPEPELELELEPEELPPHPSDITPATMYEIVWYREEERIAFALQPVDGRAAPWARYRSSSFAWEEDSDPPASLKAAQSSHGKLRARLRREGWQASGRGDSWFSHRFEPPASAPHERAQDPAD
jgi:hypothetical protein